jgi:arginyl-tRNA synthetase
MDFKQEIVSLLSKATGLSLNDVAVLVSVPPESKLGDYAFPCFRLGKNSKEEAEKLKKKLKLPEFIFKVEVAGPYLNFFLDKKYLIEMTLTEIIKQREKYGCGKLNKKVVLEFCSPNTNKPLHLGHVRNMSLGDALGKIISFQGSKVHAVEIINDRGVHICKSMLAYQRWGKNCLPNKKSDHFVGDYYVLFAKKAQEDPTLEEEAQKMLVAWEHDDKEVRAIWKKMNKWVLDGFNQTYQRFGIKFEKDYYESELYKFGKDIVMDALKQGIFLRDEKGAIIAPLEKDGLTNKIVLRADGTSVYITQDLYLAQKRFDDFHFDEMIYVTATEQILAFKQLFRILGLLKKPYAQKLYHFSYGMVNLPSGRMKSREGTVVDADDLMDEVCALALSEVEKRYTTLSLAEKKRRAEFIGISAIKFFMLRTDAVRDIIFNPEESLSFEGETGPYLQYTHARACSILRKAGKKSVKCDYDLLRDESEFKLTKMLSDFSLKVKEAGDHFKVHVLCRYLLDLAQSFNEFYHALPVISDDKELMKARLVLVDCVRQVLANGLKLLGIEAPEEM